MKNIEVDAGCGLDAIRHSGVIKMIDPDFYYVTIVAQSACAACHAKGVCNVTDLNEEVVEVPRTGSTHYEIGDNVQVVMKKSLGTRAVMLGYIIPFLLVLFTLIIVLEISGNEAAAGLVSLAILVPYYLFLNFSKKRLKKTFVFSIQ